MRPLGSRMIGSSLNLLLCKVVSFSTTRLPYPWPLPMPLSLPLLPPMFWIISCYKKRNIKLFKEYFHIPQLSWYSRQIYWSFDIKFWFLELYAYLFRSIYINNCLYNIPVMKQCHYQSAKPMVINHFTIFGYLITVIVFIFNKFSEKS